MGMVVRRVSQVLGLTNSNKIRNISFKSLDPPPLPSPSLSHGIHVFHCPVSHSLVHIHSMLFLLEIRKEWFFDDPLLSLEMGFFGFLKWELNLCFFFCV